ncbi:hypothetical protein COL922a_014971, partial [Colletotrichum nupharicola]
FDTPRNRRRLPPRPESLPRRPTRRECLSRHTGKSLCQKGSHPLNRNIQHAPNSQAKRHWSPRRTPKAQHPRPRRPPRRRPQHARPLRNNPHRQITNRLHIDDKVHLPRIPPRPLLRGLEERRRFQGH